MISVPTGVRIWLATSHTNMRWGMFGLALQVQQGIQQVSGPLSSNRMWTFFSIQSVSPAMRSAASRPSSESAYPTWSGTTGYLVRVSSRCASSC